jgi:hypothetical protein
MGPSGPAGRNLARQFSRLFGLKRYSRTVREQSSQNVGNSSRTEFAKCSQMYSNVLGRVGGGGMG